MNKGRALDIGRRIVIATVIVIISWLLAVNALLWSGLVERLVSRSYGNEKTEVEIEHGFAWCLIPTIVHVNDFELKVDAREYQLQLSVPKGTLNVELYEMVTRTFYAEHIEGENVVLKVALKKHPTPTTLAQLELYPSIEGFAPPVVTMEEKITKKGWDIVMPSIHGTFEQVWIGPYNITGDIEAAGGIQVGIDKEITLGPIMAVGHEAALHIGENALLEQAEIGGMFAYGPYHSLNATREDKMRALGAWVRLDAQVVELAAASPLLPPTQPMSLSGQGRIDVVGGISEGKLLGGTWLALALRDVGASREGFSVNAEGLDLEARAPQSSQLDAEARLSDAAFSHDDGGAFARLAALGASASIDGVDLAGSPGLDVVRAELDELVVHRPSFTRKLELPIIVSDGKIELDASGTYDGRQAKFDARVDTTQTTVRARKGPFALTALAEADLTGRMSKDGSFEIRADGLELQDIDLKTKRGQSTSGWLKARRLRVEKDQGVLHLDFDVRAPDTRPIWIHGIPSAVGENLPNVHLDVETHLVGEAWLQSDRDAMRVQVRELDSAALDVEGSLAKVGKRIRAAFLMKTSQLGIRYGSGPKGVELQALAEPQWLKDQRAWVQQLWKGADER